MTIGQIASSVTYGTQALQASRMRSETSVFENLISKIKEKDEGSSEKSGVASKAGAFDTARKNVSSAVLGGEGLFNMSLQGTGVVALESNVPENELIEVELENDELKIDGNLAVCWSSNLDFTVERTTKTLVGSAVSGEGLVNVYRGTGRVLMSPVAPTSSLFESTNTVSAKAAAKNSNTLGK